MFTLPEWIISSIYSWQSHIKNKLPVKFETGSTWFEPTLTYTKHHRSKYVVDRWTVRWIVGWILTGNNRGCSIIDLALYCICEPELSPHAYTLPSVERANAECGEHCTLCIYNNNIKSKKKIKMSFIFKARTPLCETMSYINCMRRWYNDTQYNQIVQNTTVYWLHTETISTGKCPSPICIQKQQTTG